MGLKVIQLDDTQVSVVLVGLMLAHNKYINDNDNESAIMADVLIDLVKDGDLFLTERGKK